jgi:hypothetical protein
VEHVVVPLWSMKEVQRVKEKIVSDILVFQNKVKARQAQQRKEEKDQERETLEGKGASVTTLSNEGKERELLEDKHSPKFKTLLPPLVDCPNPLTPHLDSDPRDFNAAEFLFPSYRLAQLFPEYAESELILQYKTPWPKKSFKRAEKTMRRRYDKRFEFIPRTIGRVSVFMLTNLIKLPSSIQDMGLRMMLLTLCGYVLRLHLLLFEVNPLLAFAPLALVVTVVHLFFFSGRKVRHVASTYPLAKETEETFKGTEELSKDKPKEEESEVASKEAEHVPLIPPPLSQPLSRPLSQPLEPLPSEPSEDYFTISPEGSDDLDALGEEESLRWSSSLSSSSSSGEQHEGSSSLSSSDSQEASSSSEGGSSCSY